MDITIKTTVSQLDEQTYAITSLCQVGEKTIRRDEAYHVPMLMESRFLSGTLEERLETLRQSAEKVTEKEIRAVAAHLMAQAAPAAVVTTGTLGQEAQKETPKAPTKKPRASKKGTPAAVLKGADTVLSQDLTATTSKE